MRFTDILAGVGGLALAGVAAVGEWAPPASATNGYFLHGYSAAQNAMGGAGTALTEDALVVAVNPAGAVWVGHRLDLDITVFSRIALFISLMSRAAHSACSVLICTEC